MLEYNNDTKVYKISYLLLADTIERLDMILLELRHLQRNIIYSMREPGFNALLRFEEDFLWGQGWDDFFKKYTVENEDSVIDEHILHYPAPDRLVEFPEDSEVPKKLRTIASDLVHQNDIDPYDNSKQGKDLLKLLEHLGNSKKIKLDDAARRIGLSAKDISCIRKILSYYNPSCDL